MFHIAGVSGIERSRSRSEGVRVQQHAPWAACAVDRPAAAGSLGSIKEVEEEVVRYCYAMTSILQWELEIKVVARWASVGQAFVRCSETVGAPTNLNPGWTISPRTGFLFAGTGLSRYSDVTNDLVVRRRLSGQRCSSSMRALITPLDLP